MFILHFFFFLGLIIGSFLNVVVLRGERGESLGGRSHCPHCQALIHWYDNIPVVSYLLLWGQCRQCHTRISWQYPVVELTTGIIFAGIGSNVMAGSALTNSHIAVVTLFLVLASLLIAIFVSDLRTMEIPLFLLWGGLAVALALAVAQELWPDTLPSSALAPSFVSRLVGGGAAAFLFYVLVFFSHETWMGMGDVWVAAILGLVTGAETILFGLTVSFGLGAIVGVALLLLRRKGWESQIAFAPFLIAGIFLMQWWQWTNPTWFHWFVLPLYL